jgi:hypothetical protein
MSSLSLLNSIFFLKYVIKLHKRLELAIILAREWYNRYQIPGPIRWDCEGLPICSDATMKSGVAGEFVGTSTLISHKA